MVDWGALSVGLKNTREFWYGSFPPMNYSFFHVVSSLECLSQNVYSKAHDNSRRSNIDADENRRNFIRIDQIGNLQTSTYIDAVKCIHFMCTDSENKINHESWW